MCLIYFGKFAVPTCVFVYLMCLCDFWVSTKKVSVDILSDLSNYYAYSGLIKNKPGFLLSKFIRYLIS